MSIYTKAQRDEAILEILIEFESLEKQWGFRPSVVQRKNELLKLYRTASRNLNADFDTMRKEIGGKP